MKSLQDKYWDNVTKGKREMFSNLVNFLSGKKTYIIAIVGALFNVAVALGWVTPDNLEQINAVLLALGLGALRAGVSKSEL